MDRSATVPSHLMRRSPCSHLKTPAATAVSEKKSAGKKRPVFESALRDAKAGRFCVLVVWAIDRFGRSMTGNLNDLLALDAAGVQVVSCREPWLIMNGPVERSGSAAAAILRIGDPVTTPVLERVA